MILIILILNGVDNYKMDLKDYINYSGGAKGSDTMWQTIGSEFGLGLQVNYRPEDLQKLNDEEFEECEKAYLSCIKILKRPFMVAHEYVGKLLRRDYMQVRSAKAVFAIGMIIENKQPDSRGYINKSGKQIISGGTGYAVEMGIQMNKPVYVFDQIKNQWFKWNGLIFEMCEVPVLTKKYAGIGTREINSNGLKAIKEIYQKTCYENRKN